jgi:cytochrome c553
MRESQLQALACIVALVVIPLVALGSEPAPPWAFAVTPASYVPPVDDGSIRRVPGSTAGYTQTQIDDNFNAPDWFPNEHRPMPRVVAHGDGTMVWACAKCHLASGLGHPESAGLAGLPAGYIAEQIADYKDGSRKGSAKMVQIAKAMSAEDTAQAAKWFSQLPRRPWVRVVQTATVPVTFVADGNMRLQSPGSATEPLADRIIELPLDVRRTLSRDPHSGYVAYVPPGSIAGGKVLVTSGSGGKTLACANCHGASLTGIANTPSIAGRSPVYVFRQLFDFRTGVRRGPRTLMKAVVSRLTNHDMLVISAYLASLQP